MDYGKLCIHPVKIFHLLQGQSK